MQGRAHAPEPQTEMPSCRMPQLEGQRRRADCRLPGMPRMSHVASQGWSVTLKSKEQPLPLAFSEVTPLALEPAEGASTSGRWGCGPGCHS